MIFRSVGYVCYITAVERDNKSADLYFGTEWSATRTWGKSSAAFKSQYFHIMLSVVSQIEIRDVECEPGVFDMLHFGAMGSIYARTTSSGATLCIPVTARA